jgi:hypothetical protein
MSRLVKYRALRHICKQIIFVKETLQVRQSSDVQNIINLTQGLINIVQEMGNRIQGLDNRKKY